MYSTGLRSLRQKKPTKPASHFRLLQSCLDAQRDTTGALSCNEQPLVSIDFNHNPSSCNFDANHTRVSGRLVKVLAWYDNEWGFSNRMLDTGCLLGALSMRVHAAA